MKVPALLVAKDSQVTGYLSGSAEHTDYLPGFLPARQMITDTEQQRTLIWKP